MRAKLSYSTITQKMALHMSPGTDFTLPCQSAMGTILGFYPSVVTGPARDRGTRVYTHSRVGQSNLPTGARSHTVSHHFFVTPKKTDDSPYSFRQEVNTVVNMNQGFDTIYVYTAVCSEVMPLIKRGAVALGKGALKTGVRIADDVLSGQSLKGGQTTRQGCW